MQKQDLVVVGGGLVGLATAYQYLLRHPGTKVIVLEKEAGVALHQSSRNSGVLHSGIYYKPGSLKAINCIQGRTMMQRFCEEQGVACRMVPKLIVATHEKELQGLQNIFERGVANGIRCKVIEKDEIHSIEPHVRAVRAIHVLDAGICDFKGVARALQNAIQKHGGSVILNSRVIGIRQSGDDVQVSSEGGEFQAQRLVNTSGLYSDRVLALSGHAPKAKIVPFRGEYYTLRPERAHLCKSLVYPVPNPNFPFLGVHFTRGIDGVVECGPNAVLALAREGYSWGAVNFKDVWDTFSYRGFRRFAVRHLREGWAEIQRSFSRRIFLTALRELIPEVDDADLVVGPRGVRAQAMDDGGRLLDDFCLQREGRNVHVLNAPSPAATSCLSIGEKVVELML